MYSNMLRTLSSDMEMYVFKALVITPLTPQLCLCRIRPGVETQKEKARAQREAGQRHREQTQEDKEER